jgi:hypothetical protein
MNERKHRHGFVPKKNIHLCRLHCLILKIMNISLSNNNQINWTNYHQERKHGSETANFAFLF